VASDRNSNAVQRIQPNIIHRTGLPIRQDNGFAHDLGLSLIELGQNRGRSRLGNWHSAPFNCDLELAVIDYGGRPAGASGRTLDQPSLLSFRRLSAAARKRRLYVRTAPSRMWYT